MGQRTTIASACLLLLISGAALLVPDAGIAQQTSKKPKASDYTCGDGNHALYRGGTPETSYPYPPAYDIHPMRSACYDSPLKRYAGKEESLKHPAVCFDPDIGSDLQSNPYLSGQSTYRSRPDLSRYQCGQSTRLTNIDNYCSYIGQGYPPTRPLPGGVGTLGSPYPIDGSYMEQRTAMQQCLVAYIAEYAYLADTYGLFILQDPNNIGSELNKTPIRLIDDPGLTDDQKQLATAENYCYRTWQAEAKPEDPTVTWQPLNAEFVDMGLKGLTQKRVYPKGNATEIQRIRDACNIWSPRHNFRDKHYGLLTQVGQVFGYDTPDMYWIDENKYEYKDGERIDVTNMRYKRFEEQFFDNFDLPALRQYCSQKCRTPDPKTKQLPADSEGEYNARMLDFYKARNAALPNLQRPFSNILPPPNMRWIYEEPNILSLADLSTDPGLVTKKDGEPRPRKSEEMLFWSAFDSTKPNIPSGWPPYTTPTPVKYKDLRTKGAAEDRINQAIDRQTKTITTKTTALMDAPPETSKRTVIQGPPGCDAGGTFEMSLYQARCIDWFGANCLCDYDKLFRKGSALAYVMARAGTEFQFDRIKKDTSGNEIIGSDGCPETEQFTYYWPLIWRGDLNDSFAKRKPDASPPITTNLSKAKPGNILLWRDVGGQPKHAAYVEGISWDESTDAPGTPGDSIVVSEANWGKWPDICGSTDMWGQVTSRIIYHPSTPVATGQKGPTGYCSDSDLKECIEGMWSQVEIYDAKTDLWGNYEDPAPDEENPGDEPESCYLPKDFLKLVEDDDDARKCRRSKYTVEEKIQMIRARQQLKYEKDGKEYIGCDPPPELRRLNAVVPSINMNTLRGRAPQTGQYASPSRVGRQSCVTFDCRKHNNEMCPDMSPLVCNAECTYWGSTGARPGRCPQGISKPEGCAVPGSTGTSGASTSGLTSTSGTTSGTTGTTSGSTGTTSGTTGTTSGPGSSSGSTTSSSSSGSSSGAVCGTPPPACAPDIARCPTFNNCPSSSCKWLEDRVYSEQYIDQEYPGLVPTQTYADPVTGEEKDRLVFPREWLCEDPELRTKLVTGTPKAGDVAVLLDGRYCMGQAGIVLDVTKNAANEDCMVLQSVNWLGNCENYDSGNCYQSCSFFGTAPAIHTQDPLLPGCLTRRDLGTSGFILRDNASSSSGGSSSSGS